jgi:hypothetical protein
MTFIKRSQMEIYSKNKRDSRVRDYLPVKNILWAASGELLPENMECLLRDVKIQPYVNNSKSCIMKSGSGILLDFGRELHGGIRIAVGKCTCNTIDVRIRFGESVSEAMSEPNNDHAVHDSIVKLPRLGMAEFGNTGFRFVRIDVPDSVPAKTVELLGINAVAVYRDLEYIGSFKCDDERLNKIWQTGAYTVHLNMQDYIYDGIKRDRLVWIGDLHPEIRVICSVFDDKSLIPESLDFVRDKTPLPGFMNNISSYSLWWIINQHDWFWYSGDIDYLKKQRPYLNQLLAIMEKYVDEHGREQLPKTRFLDWNSFDDPAVTHAGLQGLMLWAFKAGEYLSFVLGDKNNQTLCASIISRMKNHNPPAGKSKTANAFKVIAGICSPGPVNANILAHDELNGLSTFLGYYVLKARALAGDYQGALNVIRKYWGTMLDFGATTFWEDFDIKWTENASPIDQMPVPGKDDLHADFGAHCYKGLRHSLCHGWAGGPTAWLSEHVLGVKILEPGAGIVKVTPELGDLKTVEGMFPTPHGPISISAEKSSNGKTVCKIQAPAGIRIVTS